MDRKECYRLTHPLSKISGYATVTNHQMVELTVESYKVVMLLIFILIIISIPSPSHSFIPGKEAVKWLLLVVSNSGVAIQVA